MRYILATEWEDGFFWWIVFDTKKMRVGLKTTKEVAIYVMNRLNVLDNARGCSSTE